MKLGRMSTQEARAIEAAFVRERLRWADVCKRYPDRWVVAVELDPVWARSLGPHGTGLVIGVFEDRVESNRFLKDLRPRSEHGSFWTGAYRIPPVRLRR